MRITIIGSGYVGLVTGACFAEFGHYVTCVDKDASKINLLKSGKIPIYEPGLESLVQLTQNSGRLAFTTQAQDAIAQADAVFLAVGTPSCHQTGKANLDYVFEAAREVAKALKKYTVVVTKSTVPVGTARKVAQIIKETNPDADFDVASNPEFLREGSALNDFMRPDRVVIGTDPNSKGQDRARAVLQQLYRPLYLIETPIVFTNIETAEIIKYAANAFLATKVAFINEMADICEKAGGNVQDVAKAIGLDGRIGRKFLHAGPGYGGSCFPKDTRALVQTARELEAPTKIIESVVTSNETRKRLMAEKIIQAAGGNVKNKTVAVLGVTFKPNTDDLREAPSLDIIPLLQSSGARVKSYDPVGGEEAARHLPHVTWCQSSYDAITGADVAVIITEWNEFRALDFEKLKEVMNYPLLVDLRNIYRIEEMQSSGIDYVSIGRPAVYAAADSQHQRKLA
jgi:UDPglucose 6-dehydrogenase